MKQQTFTSKMRELGFNSQQISSYRGKLYRSGIRSGDIAKITLEGFTHVRFFTNWFDGYAVEMPII